MVALTTQQPWVLTHLEVTTEVTTTFSTHTTRTWATLSTTPCMALDLFTAIPLMASPHFTESRLSTNYERICG